MGTWCSGSKQGVRLGILWWPFGFEQQINGLRPYHKHFTITINVCRKTSNKKEEVERRRPFKTTLVIADQIKMRSPVKYCTLLPTNFPSLFSALWNRRYFATANSSFVGFSSSSWNRKFAKLSKATIKKSTLMAYRKTESNNLYTCCFQFILNRYKASVNTNQYTEPII